jgi:hypothetical protein
LGVIDEMVCVARDAAHGTLDVIDEMVCRAQDFVDGGANRRGS